MIKATAMFSAHTIHVLIRNTFIFLTVLLLALFFWLKTGIEVDVLKLGNYKVEGLYLKLGKKLTFNAQNIIIPKSKKEKSFDDIEKTFDKIKYLFTFFDKIHLENVQFNEEHLKIIFSEELISVSHDDYEFTGQIERKEKTFLVDIPMLRLKEDNITLSGQMIYDLENDLLATDGRVHGFGINGDFTLIKEKSDVAFKVKSETFSSLRTLIERTNLSPAIEAWVLDKVKAKEYTLNELSGKGNIHRDEFVIDFDSLYAEVLFKDVKIHFHDNVDPVDADGFVLTYKDNSLLFDLKHPFYRGRRMAGSKLAITGLNTQSSVLELDLKMYTKIDDTLHEILNAYDIHIPVKHIGKASNIDFKMDIPLGSQSKASQSKLLVDVHMRKGILSIGETAFNVLSGSIYYENGILDLKDVAVEDSWYEGNVSGEIFLKKKNANLSFDAKKVVLGDKEKFLELKDKTLPFTLSYDDNLKIDIPALKVNMRKKEKGFEINIDSLSRLKPFILNEIILGLDGGRVTVNTNDFKEYMIHGRVKKNDCVFYDKKECYVQIPLKAIVNASGINVYAFDKRLHFSSKKSQLKLENINIDIKKLLTLQKKKNKNKSKKSKKSLVILGKNSKMRYDTHTLLTDSYDIDIKPNGDMEASGSLDGDIVKFSQKGKNLSLKALRVKDKLLHSLIDFDGIQEGRYSVDMFGDPDGVMYGTIIIEGGAMRDFQAYNNTLAIINVLPAIATLSDPGFSEKGFDIKEGVIEYRLQGDTLVFDSIYIKGKSATVVGKGTVHLKTKIIDMKLAIQTARELGQIVGSIPLVGEILLGKGKSLTIGLTVKGSLDKPTVQTSAAQDILSLPLLLIKRTLDTSTSVLK